MGDAWSRRLCVGVVILALSAFDKKRVAGGGIIRCGVPYAMYRLAALSYDDVGHRLVLWFSREWTCALLLLTVGWSLELSVALSLDLSSGGMLVGPG